MSTLPLSLLIVLFGSLAGTSAASTPSQPPCDHDVVFVVEITQISYISLQRSVFGNAWLQQIATGLGYVGNRFGIGHFSWAGHSGVDVPLASFNSSTFNSAVQTLSISNLIGGTTDLRQALSVAGNFFGSSHFSGSRRTLILVTRADCDYPSLHNQTCLSQAAAMAATLRGSPNRMDIYVVLIAPGANTGEALKLTGGNLQHVVDGTKGTPSFQAIWKGVAASCFPSLNTTSAPSTSSVTSPGLPTSTTSNTSATTSLSSSPSPTTKNMTNLCGGPYQFHFADHNQIVVQSPGYPASVPSFFSCSFLLFPYAEGRNFATRLDFAGTNLSSSGDLEFYDAGSQTFLRSCSSDYCHPFTVAGPIINVRFNAGSGPSKFRFTATANKSCDCGNTFLPLTVGKPLTLIAPGTITSPYPAYSQGCYCNYRFAGPSVNYDAVEVVFTKVDLAGMDSLSVIAGDGTTPLSCGRGHPRCFAYTSSSNSLSLRFRSFGSPPAHQYGSGFNISVVPKRTCVCPPSSFNLSQADSVTIHSPNFPANRFGRCLCSFRVFTTSPKPKLKFVTDLASANVPASPSIYFYDDGSQGRDLIQSCGAASTCPTFERLTSAVTVNVQAFGGNNSAFTMLATAEARAPCDASPCKNGGTCQNLNAAFKCTCPPLWTGFTCTRPATVVSVHCGGVYVLTARYETASGTATARIVRGGTRTLIALRGSTLTLRPFLSFRAATTYPLNSDHFTVSCTGTTFSYSCSTSSS